MLPIRKLLSLARFLKKNYQAIPYSFMTQEINKKYSTNSEQVTSHVFSLGPVCGKVSTCLATNMDGKQSRSYHFRLSATQPGLTLLSKSLSDTHGLQRRLCFKVSVESAEDQQTSD